MYSIATPPTNQ